MVVAILTGHAPVRTLPRTMDLFEGDPVCRFCGQQAETVQHIICRCEGTGPLPLHQRHKAAESVLKWKFRAAQ
jgi:hypothetical protein